MFDGSCGQDFRREFCGVRLTTLGCHMSPIFDPLPYIFPLIRSTSSFQVAPVLGDLDWRFEGFELPLCSGSPKLVLWIGFELPLKLNAHKPHLPKVQSRPVHLLAFQALITFYCLLQIPHVFCWAFFEISGFYGEYQPLVSESFLTTLVGR